MAVETDSPQRIARLTPLPDALARLDALVAPVTSRVVDVSLALGHTLAEDVIVAAPIPPTACALRDGWAVRSDLTIDASGYAPAPLCLACARRAGDTVIDAAIACIGDAIGSQGGVATLAEQGDLADVLAHADADAVVVVGGTGSGRRDTTVRTLASMGEVLVHGIALLPGETTALGTVGARPVLALPGRLDAALAAWHLLGRSMLARLAGNRETLAVRTAWLTHKVSSPVGFSELVPVRCEGVSASPIASGYVPLAALAQANGWVFIPAESEGHPAQSEVVVRPWP